MSENIDTQKTYDSLKDFQKVTVEFAYERLKNNGRYLIADEVGLGKTMIAKGIIAKTYDELKNKKDNIEIVYITTNQSIASQNIETLKFQNTEATSHRLTLHITKPKMKNQKINFMSFTVGTSIEIIGSGNHTEREFLVYLLRHEKYNLLKGITEKTIWKFFKQGVDTDKNFMEDNNFHVSRKYLNEKFKIVNNSFIQRFTKSVEASQEIKKIMHDIRNLNLYNEESYNIIEILRKILLVENLNEIKPKLIILDEFQRFNKILVDSSNTEANKNDGLDKIMEMLFNQNSKILLLSATPYKLLDCKDNEHYNEFYGLVKWLYKDDNEITDILKELFLNLHVKQKNKEKIETILKGVMCRTERYSFDEDNFEELKIKDLKLQNTMKHYLKEYAKYSSLNIQGATRYLKSAPSALNYMKETGYVAKREFLSLSDDIKSKINENKKHPKLQMLNQEVKNQKLKEFIWMPPLVPYVNAKNASNILSTKMLIFSQWDFVPDSIVGSFSINERKKENNYTDIKSFKDRGKLLVVTHQDKNPYNYEGTVTFIELINKTKREGNISEIDSKILLGSPANVIYRSILKYGNIEETETLKFYIEPYEKTKNEDWKSFSHLFLHHLGKRENYRIMDIEKNESNKVEKILNYCIKNNIQSMFDEYVHLLTDSPRYKNIQNDEDKITYLLGIFQTIFSMRPNEVTCDKYENKIKVSRKKTSKFAMRISKSSMSARGDSEKPLTADNVKISFNSPFSPFILATTSIGQEGLDFHPYCHQIWHWDLPSSPVDLEQREGRVNRYKNYAVRKNIAKSFNNKCWIEKFEKAKKEKGCDFTAFWLYTSEIAQEKIQRVIPLLPLSREYYKYEHLKEQLNLYRGVMGQKEQDEKMNTNENIIQISLKPQILLKEL